MVVRKERWPKNSYTTIQLDDTTLCSRQIPVLKALATLDNPLHTHPRVYTLPKTGSATSCGRAFNHKLLVNNEETKNGNSADSLVRVSHPSEPRSISVGKFCRSPMLLRIQDSSSTCSSPHP